MPHPDPFWLCHQCGAQMRPITVDGVPHCASCNSEFIEILDNEINPDPHYELPTPPPTRPGRVPPPPGPPPGRSPLPSYGGGRPNPNPNPNPNDERPPAYGEEGEPSGAGGLLGGLFNFFGGGGAQPPTNSSDMPQPPRAQPSGRGNDGGGGGRGRSWEWNFGNGSVRVQGFSGPIPARNASPFGNPFLPQANPWVGGYAGAPGNPNQGLDAFFRGFGAPPQRGGRGPEPLAGGDLLQALMQIVMEEGVQPIPLGPNGQLGDYVMTDRGFNDILERLMQAAGPQGPLPASQDTISHLERFTFTEKILAESQYKDCPVCMDDFKVGDEVMKIPCGHAFHPDCLTPWLETNGSCPVCRYSLVPEDGQPGAPGARANADPNAQPAAAVPSASPTGPTPAAATATAVAGGALAGAQGAITSVLNRLFGQAGTTDTPTAPADIHRPSSQPTAPANPEDDPPDAPLIDFDEPVRTSQTSTPRRALPEWAQLARGMQDPGARSTPQARSASPPRASSSSSARPSPPLPALSWGTSTFGRGGLVPQTDLFDSDVAQFRATRAAGDVASIPWSAPNHQHVGVRYALLGDPEVGGDDPLLFCHTDGRIGDFSLLQLRRVAGRAEHSEGPVVEGRMCCHAVVPGIGGEAEMGRVMRECRVPSEEEEGEGQGEGKGLSYRGERPGSVVHEDID